MSTTAPVSLAPERIFRGTRLGKAAKVRAYLGRARELVPLTLRGAAVAAMSLAALLFYGFGALDGVWYVAGIGLLGLCVLALATVVIAALGLNFVLARRPPPRLGRLGSETGRPLESGFELASLRAWVLVEVQLRLREPRGAEVEAVRDGGRLRERVRFVDHGEVRTLARTIVVRDVFGIASVGLRRAEEVEIDVLPHAGALRSLPLLRSLSGGDDIPHPLGVEQGDRLELRRYAPGDPARFIHWKVYARTRKLVLRMPERALSRAQRVAAYLVAGPRDGASAAAARVALEEGAFGADFRFGADGSPTPTREVSAALVAVRRSSAARAQSAERLDTYVQELDREGPSSLVLFVPAAEGPHVERIGGLLKKRGRAARVVIGVDGVSRDEARTFWTRLRPLALKPQSSPRVSVSLLRELVASYRRYGCEVVVVDRESGRVLGDAHLVAQRTVASEVAA